MQNYHDKSSPLKHEHLSRELRSSSPAVKRPASDMGAQDREEHGEVTNPGTIEEVMAVSSPTDTSDAITQTISNSKRRKNSQPNNTASKYDVPHESDPKSVAQTAPSSEDSSATMDTLVGDSATSTTATSVVEAEQSIPSYDEQVRKVKDLLDVNPTDKQKGYVVSSKWLRRVQARSSAPPKGVIEKSATAGEVGPIDNSDIAMVAEDSGSLKDEAGESFTFLRPNLSYEADLLVLPLEAWGLVVSWYGVAKTSPIITRYAHQVSENDPYNCQYELYPPVYSLLKVAGTTTAQVQRDADTPPPRLLASRQTRFMDWLKNAKELLHIDMDTKVRVWRIIGGIKSTSASSILTPAASRSASPAPGTELTANAGEKMLIDVNSFAALATGEQRELVDKKDETMNSNYNGRADLDTVGLGRSDVIVLEEINPKDESWPSENLKFSLKGSAKARNLTVAGTKPTPNPTMVTRGRSQQHKKGIVGLSNLGNTCYMNAALQSVRSVNELTQYFLSGYYKKELNYDNPLGNHGEVAKAYANLLDGIYSTNNTFTPSGFKRVVGKYGPGFAGYGQQDSQEFLAFLLDGLSEDLNRIHKKPYIDKPDSTDEMVDDIEALRKFADENWANHKARNDSVVTDLFAGMYKSTLTCPECDKVSIVFDPFTSLTLGLPIENNFQKDIIYFPLYNKPLTISIDIDKNATILDVKKFISQRTHFDPAKMICAESYKERFFKLFDNNDVLSEAGMQPNDMICVYELDEIPTNYDPDKKVRKSTFSNTKDGDRIVSPDSPASDELLIPLFNRTPRVDRMNRSSNVFFGHPTFVVLSRADRASYDALLKKCLGKVMGMTTLDLMSKDLSFSTPNDEAEDSDTMLIPESGSTGLQSPSASATSVQGEDSLVDISMKEEDTRLGGRQDSGGMNIKRLLSSNAPLSSKFHSLFDIRAVETNSGIPLGWNDISEDKPYISVRERAQKQSQIPIRPKREIDEGYDSDTDEIAESPQDGSDDTAETTSDSGSSKPQHSDDDTSLPEAADIISGKDTRGATRHAKQRTYKRKGRTILGRVVQRRSPHAQPKLVTRPTNAELISSGNAIVLDWPEDTYDALFGASDAKDEMRGTPTWVDIEPLVDEALAAKRENRLARRRNGISLEDCLNEFGKSEKLSEQNAWYCPRCKEHRQADKKFELWKVPDVLVMHLKRFSSSRNFRDKLDVKVDYPIDGLDITEYVQDQRDGKPLVYDLIAVDNHYGGLGGGHYTAYAKNAVTNDWHDYNDSHVSRVDAQSVVAKSAYMLFYRRRTDSPLGGPKMESILSNLDSEELSTASRETSPSGEGQRLGGSSHNGSSSASAAQVHHVGDGGLALILSPNNNKSRSQTLGPPSQRSMMSRSIATLNGGPASTSTIEGLNDESGRLPAYDDHDADMLLDDNLTGEPFIGPQPEDNPWPNNNDQSWGFHNINAPPSSNVGDDDDRKFEMFTARRSSDASAANASSTGVQGGSDRDSLPDMDDDPNATFEEHEDVRLRTRASAPSPIIHEVGLDNDDDDDEELPVVELKIEESQEEHL